MNVFENVRNKENAILSDWIQILDLNQKGHMVYPNGKLKNNTPIAGRWNDEDL